LAFRGCCPRDAFRWLSFFSYTFIRRDIYWEVKGQSTRVRNQHAVSKHRMMSSARVIISWCGSTRMIRGKKRTPQRHNCEYVRRWWENTLFIWGKIMQWTI
jgi:hypothetical protein